MATTLNSPTFWIYVSAYMIFSVLAQDGNEFVYYDFGKANLHMDGVAKILPNGLLQLTNTSKQKYGHAFYKLPLDFNKSLSFSTEFVFAIVPEATEWGHGIAFVVSKSLDLRNASSNSYLGIFNTSNDGNSSNHILAVELDITESAGDISDNHVGIDENRIVSIESANASYFSEKEGKNIGLLLASGDHIRAWIEYDGPVKLLNVTLAPDGVPRPSRPLLSRLIDLSDVFLDQMYVGFSGSTGTLTSNQYICGWSFSKIGKAKSLESSKLAELPPPPKPLHSPSPLSAQLAIIIPASVGAALVILISGFVYFYWSLRYAEVYEDWEQEYSPQRCSFRTLYKATNGFADLIGSGGFGKVYKGEYPQGRLIAVKRVTHDAQQGMRQFVAEIVCMERLKHKNLVQLFGYCRRKGELLLVYEYMPNGSLDDYLFKDKKPKISWSQRFNIIEGVASALLYLHEEFFMEQVVLHRDIKASNILLDANMNGRLGDFGLARFHDRGRELQATHVVGTVGYMAPELSTIGVATTCTDVYAFGAFMLEVVCGRRPVDPEKPKEEVILVKWVVECGRKGGLLDCIDPKLDGKCAIKEAELVLKLGLLCSQLDPEARPNMRKVVQYLEGNDSLPDLTLDTAEFSVSKMYNKGFTTASSSTYSFDTASVLFHGR